MKKSGSEIDISVIIPIYNVEEYISECLDSLERQGDVSLEVIMVDDASTDRSGDIAEEYASRFDNYTCYHKPNGGPGSARNYGVKFAKGEFIAFVDPDDIVAAGAYSKMLDIAKRDGSDMVICGVGKLNSTEVWKSSLHEKAFRGFEPITHVTRNHNLLYDTTSPNRLIRRDFYERNGFLYPEGIRYEDIPTVTAFHFMADQVSVLYDVGYYWREREGKSRSITQDTELLVNLEDRLAALALLDSFFEEKKADDDLRLAKEIKVLTSDLNIFINLVEELPEDRMTEMLGLINDYISRSISEQAMMELPLMLRQKYRYAADYDIESLKKARDYQKNDYRNAAITEEDGHLYIDLPDDLFSIKTRRAENDLKNTPFRSKIYGFDISKSGVELVGSFYRPGINIRPGEQKVSASLYDILSSKRYPLEVEFISPEIIADKVRAVTGDESGNDDMYDYSGTFVRLSTEFDDKTIPDRDTEFLFLISTENRFFSDTFFITTRMVRNVRKHMGRPVLIGDSFVTVVFSDVDKLKLLVHKDYESVRDFYVEGGKLLLETEGDPLQLTAMDEDDNVRFDRAEKDRHVIDLAKLSDDSEYRIIRGSYAYEARGVRYDYAMLKKKKMKFFYREDALVIAGSLKPGIMTVQVKSDVSSLAGFEKEGSQIRLSVRSTGLKNHHICKAELSVEDDHGHRTVLAGSNDLIKKDGILCCEFDCNIDNMLMERITGKRSPLLISYSDESGNEIVQHIYSEVALSVFFEGTGRKLKLYRDKHTEVIFSSQVAEGQPWEEKGYSTI